MSDSILFWNAVALEADRIAHTDPDKREQNGPTLSSRALAIVHLAMYDLSPEPAAAFQHTRHCRYHRRRQEQKPMRLRVLHMSPFPLFTELSERSSMPT